MTSKTILISGGAGFIGVAFAETLLLEGQNVHIIDNLHPQIHGTSTWPDRLGRAAYLAVDDVAEVSTWERAIQACRPNVIVHLAAETGTGQSLTEACRHARTNVVGTAALTDACTRLDFKPLRIVLASSRAVYGEGQWIDRSGCVHEPGARSHEQLTLGRWDPQDNDGEPMLPLPNRAGITPANPASIYAATKLTQEHILQAWTAAMGVPLSILRCQNVYGAGQSIRNPYSGVLVHWASSALVPADLEIFEGGQVKRDFVHVQDVAGALRLAIGDVGHDSYIVDIGTGNPIALVDAANIICECADSGAKVTVSKRFRDGDVRSAYADISAARSRFGFTPSIAFVDGVAELVEWVRITQR